MNHDCHGDIFTRWGKRWGRCFADSTLFELQDGTEFCPACKRPWVGMEDRSDFDPDKSTPVVLNIDVPQLKYMLEQKEQRIKHLEAQLEQWKKMYFDAKGIERV